MGRKSSETCLELGYSFGMLTIISIWILTAEPSKVLTKEDSIHELHFSWATNGTIAGSLVGVWLLSETAFKPMLSPQTCRWCQSNPFDEWGRGLRASKGEQAGVARLSDALGFAALPLITLGAHGFAAFQSNSERFLLEDAVMITEATSAALVFTQIIKFSVGRERPFVSQLSAEEKRLLPSPDDSNLSFFSGHSSFAFALFASTATVAHLRNYSHQWLIWALGLPLAMSLPLLRMGADKHYLSDVLVGTLVGGVCGTLIPRMFHNRKAAMGTQTRLVPSPLGISFVGVF